MNQISIGVVDTWYDERGSGQPVVLLHPGGVGVDSRAFDKIVDGLAQRLRVYMADRRGHGRTPDVAGPITYQLMAEDTVGFLHSVVGGPASLVGYSDGAVVALAVARLHGDLVNRLALVAGVFSRDGWTYDEESDPPGLLVDSYAKVSPDGREHYPVVAAKLAQMHATEPAFTAADLADITCRTLVMVADDDEVILEHAVDTYRALVNSELAVVPGTSHGLLVEKPDLCNQILLEFLTADPVQTIAPIRRAHRSNPPSESAAHET